MGSRGDNATAREYFTALVDEPSARKQANHFLAEILIDNRELARKHHELSERLPPDFPWPNPARPLLFWHVIGKEEFSASGTSYLNKIEAEVVEKVIEKAQVKPVKAAVETKSTQKPESKSMGSSLIEMAKEELEDE